MPAHILENSTTLIDRLFIYYYTFLRLQQHVLIPKFPRINAGRKSILRTLSPSSHYTGLQPNAFPLSLFISLFIFSLGERTIGVGPVNKTDPPLEAVILVRGRGEVGFGHCRLDAVLFWASLGYI